VNARAAQEYQYTREEFLGMSFSDLGRRRDREQTSSRLKHIFPTETTLLPVLQHRRKDGSLFMVNFQVRPTTYRNQPAIIASVWDVTERLEKHAMLVQASKMATLGEMATGIAHELNQPLNVIRLGCDYLEKKMKSYLGEFPKDLHQVTKELTTNVERASRIINHLRQFGRKSEPTMSPVDINKPITDVFAMLRTQFEAHSITWNLDLGYNLPNIMGDENQLEQVFINLVINARDAILALEKAPGESGDGPDKTITIRTLLENERIVVTVTDTGHGIPESLLDRVFEPFFTTKKPGKGTGLGLSISYGIIKEHNGTIEIVSTQKQGTSFRLTFPALANGDST
jgi:PAS domain S-box-containing protein